MRPTIIRGVRTHDNPACLCGKCRPIASTKDRRAVKTKDEAERTLVATIPIGQCDIVQEDGFVLVYRVAADTAATTDAGGDAAYNRHVSKAHAMNKTHRSFWARGQRSA